MRTLLIAMVIAAAAPAAAQSDRPAAPKAKAASVQQPMVFFLAKGEDNECGHGCSEWIAAEGRVDAGSAKRLSEILNRIGKRKLPIYFHSPGGLGNEGIDMGRFLREREMTAGVSETIPAGCAGASASACRALKQSGKVLPSALRHLGSCSSSCVLTLVGAKVRIVPPGALVGVHSVKLVLSAPNGRKVDPADANVAKIQKSRMAEVNLQHRLYLQEMKIDPRLYDLAARIPHEKIHYLSRNELIGYGIDPRQFPEARWVGVELEPQRFLAMKYFIEARGEGRKDLRISALRLECGGTQRVKLTYYRNLGTAESEPRRTIRLAVGGSSGALSGPSAAVKLAPIDNDAWFNIWGTIAPFDLFEAAAARDTIEVVELASADVAARTTKLATAGLSQAVAKLRGQCGGSVGVDCWTADSGGVGSVLPACTVPFRAPQ